MNRTKVLVIDAERQEIREQYVSCLEDMQLIVGGLICHALETENGDCIFVNDEGLLMKPQSFFYYQGAEAPFAGSGYLTGPADEEGYETDVQTTVEELREKITFMGIPELRDWIFTHPQGGMS
jgi:hypothetical protein